MSNTQKDEIFEFVVEQAASIFRFLAENKYHEAAKRNWQFMREFIVFGEIRYEATAWLRYTPNTNTLEIRGMVITERENTNDTRRPDEHIQFSERERSSQTH